MNAAAWMLLVVYLALLRRAGLAAGALDRRA